MEKRKLEKTGISAIINHNQFDKKAPPLLSNRVERKGEDFFIYIFLNGFNKISRKSGLWLTQTF